MQKWAKEIEEDLAWREGELGILKLMTSGANHETSKYSSLLRALWALLYAHYEGFSKFLWDLYLSEIESEGLPRESLERTICVFSLKKEMKKIRTSTDEELFSFLLSCPIMKEKASFPEKLETDSNLWPNVLIENCEKVGIACSIARTSNTFLQTLVSRRNDIAHGKKVQIKNLDEYQRYEDKVFLVMHELAVSVTEQLDKKAFLKRI